MARKITPLKEKEVQKKLEALSAWTPNKKHTQLSKAFSFQSPVSALAFVAKVTVHAEVMGHHPDFELSHAKVKIKLATHEVKGLTKKDFDLAKRIDKLRID